MFNKGEGEWFAKSELALKIYESRTNEIITEKAIAQ
jgi:hypothetical protein